MIQFGQHPNFEIVSCDRIYIYNDKKNILKKCLGDLRITCQ